jgi:hypothetical protein
MDAREIAYLRAEEWDVNKIAAKVTIDQTIFWAWVIAFIVLVVFTLIFSLWIGLTGENSIRVPELRAFPHAPPTDRRAQQRQSLLYARKSQESTDHVGSMLRGLGFFGRQLGLAFNA